MKALAATALGLAMLTGTASARPVVVELYTSQACSSCPPAEALLAALQKSNSNILPLSFHVTYWNGPAWSDNFALMAATDRQSWYATLRNGSDVYTPEAVVDGGTQLVGSDRAKLNRAIANATSANNAANSSTNIAVDVSNGAMLTMHVGAGAGAGAKVWLFGYDSQHTSHIGGGENSGATIHEVNVVRSITPLGSWSGIASTYTMPRPPGEHMAVIVQASNGVILGAGAN